MRLICPNCSAQYEVDANVIPSDGRDVQCSNCGHTWFQNAEDHAAEPVTPLPVADAPSDDTAAADTVEAAEGAATGNAEPLPEAEGDEAQDADKSAPVQRSSVTDSVRDILQAEVAFDQGLRAAEAGSLETQPDLGIDDAPVTAAKQDSSTQPSATKPTPETDPDKSSDALPDVDGINATLDEPKERQTYSAAFGREVRRARARRKAFTIAFMLLVVIAVASIALYVFAPILVQKVPELEGAMTRFLEVANALRAWLDTTFASIIERIGILMSQVSGDA